MVPVARGGRGCPEASALHPRAPDSCPADSGTPRTQGAWAARGPLLALPDADRAACSGGCEHTCAHRRGPPLPCAWSGRGSPSLTRKGEQSVRLEPGTSCTHIPAEAPRPAPGRQEAPVPTPTSRIQHPGRTWETRGLSCHRPGPALAVSGGPAILRGSEGHLWSEKAQAGAPGRRPATSELTARAPHADRLPPPLLLTQPRQGTGLRDDQVAAEGPSEGGHSPASTTQIPGRLPSLALGQATPRGAGGSFQEEPGGRALARS